MPRLNPDSVLSSPWKMQIIFVAIVLLCDMYAGKKGNVDNVLKVYFRVKSSFPIENKMTNRQQTRSLEPMASPNF